MSKIESLKDAQSAIIAKTYKPYSESEFNFSKHPNEICVFVSDYKVINDEFTTYTLSCRCLHIEWQVSRRYRDFENFYNKLLKDYPNLPITAKLPSKIWRTLNPKNIEERYLDLQDVSSFVLIVLNS